MIIAIDVAYSGTTALVAGVVFETWESEEVSSVVTTLVYDVAEYESGKFYKRELPCIVALIGRIEVPIHCIVIDGYIYLGADQHAGLGKYVWDHFEQKIPVIGVAKKYFHGTSEDAKIFRGKSQKPLYISSVGIGLEEAKNAIVTMRGCSRIPDFLRLVDQMSRGRIV